MNKTKEKRKKEIIRCETHRHLGVVILCAIRIEHTSLNQTIASLGDT